MENISFKTTGKKISIEDIRKFEDNIGFKFPDALIGFYLKNNGGKPKQYIYWKDDDIYVIYQFLPLYDELYKNGSLNTIYEDLCVTDNIIPKSYLPFAEESGGDFFVMELGNENESKVYYWSHEYEQPEDMTMKLISEDFETFLSFLTDKHPED